jgi:hypothetical protein
MLAARPAPAPRTAHPYLDTDVIDARAPRFNQAVIGTLSLLAVLTGWWPIYGVLALQFVLGLSFGRRWCLPCVAYFELVQPHFGEGEVEDARPPRFANQIGATVLSLAFFSSLAGLAVPGLTLTGRLLGGLVAALALLAATTGLCVGCELYKLGARLRGVRPGSVERFDLDELDAPIGGRVSPDGTTEVVVEFTHPLCGECGEVGRELRSGARPVVSVNVAQRPELARRYHVAVVPTAFAVAGDGRVLERLA